MTSDQRKRERKEVCEGERKRENITLAPDRVAGPVAINFYTVVFFFFRQENQTASDQVHHTWQGDVFGLWQESLQFSRKFFKIYLPCSLNWLSPCFFFFLGGGGEIFAVPSSSFTVVQGKPFDDPLLFFQFVIYVFAHQHHDENFYQSQREWEEKKPWV